MLFHCVVFILLSLLPDTNKTCYSYVVGILQVMKHGHIFGPNVVFLTPQTQVSELSLYKCTASRHVTSMIIQPYVYTSLLHFSPLFELWCSKNFSFHINVGWNTARRNFWKPFHKLLGGLWRDLMAVKKFNLFFIGVSTEEVGILVVIQTIECWISRYDPGVRFIIIPL